MKKNDSPLFVGKRIVITRPQGSATEFLRETLSAHGATVLEVPLLDVEYAADATTLDATWAQMGQYDWLIFTSANGVHGFFERFFESFNDIRGLGLCRIACVGPATAAAIRAYHLHMTPPPPPSPANLPPPRIFPISAFSSLPAPATPTPYRAHLRKKPAPSSRRSPFMPRRKTMSASFPPPRIFATTVPTPSFLPVPLPWSPLLPKPPASPFARAPSRPRLLPLAPRLPRPCASTAFPLPPRPPFPRPRPLLLPLPKPVQAGILLQKNCSQIPKTPKQTANQPTHE